MAAGERRKNESFKAHRERLKREEWAAQRFARTPRVLVRGEMHLRRHRDESLEEFLLREAETRKGVRTKRLRPGASPSRALARRRSGAPR